MRQGKGECREERDTTEGEMEGRTETDKRKRLRLTEGRWREEGRIREIEIKKRQREDK